MSTKKTTTMTPLEAVDIADGDLFIVVDVSDSTEASTGTNKQFALKPYIDGKFGNYSFDGGGIIENGNIVINVSANDILSLGSEIDNVIIDLDINQIDSGADKSAVTKEWVLAKLGGTAGVFAALSAEEETTITEGGTYQPLMGTYTNTPIVGFEVVATPGIKYTGTETKYFEIDWCAACSGDSNSMTVHYAIKKNGTLVDASVMGTFLKTADQVQSLSGTAVVELATDDEVQIVLTADATADKINTVHYTTTIRQFLT